MFEVGDRIVRKSNECCGFVISMEKRRTMMVEIRWDAPIPDQWLPAEEFREWDKSDEPPPTKVTSLGRTTPAYLVELRHKNPLKKNPAKMKKLAEQKLSDDLAALSNRRKQRTKGKAQKLIAKFEKGIYPVNMTQHIRTPQEQAEHERMEMSRQWKRDAARARVLSKRLDKQMRGAMERDS